jgi:hypothetical protein
MGALMWKAKFLSEFLLYIPVGRNEREWMFKSMVVQKCADKTDKGLYHSAVIKVKKLVSSVKIILLRE